MRVTLLAQGAAVLANTPVSSYQDGLAARKVMTAALDTEMLTATDDDVVLALGDLRTAVHQDLSARALQAARLITFTPPATLPALALAYDLYDDTERADEILTRNRVRHPGFVPPSPLQVLAV